MIPTWSYVKGADALYVNMYVGSTINVEKVAGTDVQMVQKTDYPWSGKVALTVNPKESRNFTLYLRAPNRTTSALYTETPPESGLMSLFVNGQPVATAENNGYVAVTRTWKAGDKVELEMPMVVQRVTADARVADDRGLTCLRCGPLIYNLERADNVNLNAALGSAPLTTVWRPDLLHGVMAIKGSWADGSPLLAVPNYARNNRLDQVAVAGGGADTNATRAFGPNSRSRSQVWIAAAPATSATP